MTWSPTKLRDFFTHFDPKNPNQLAAIDELQKDAPSLMNDDADWVKKYRTPVSAPSPSGGSSASIATQIIKDFEGFVPCPYLCPAGVWTIGYGTTYYSNGQLVQPGDPCIKEKTGAEYLEYYITHNIIPVLEKKIPTWNQMNSNQQAAIISFAYNLGTNFYGASGFSTITRALSSIANWGDVPAALMLYVNPGSSFEEGLKRRRKAEGELWQGKGPYAG